jgi:hypothetical protein
MFDSPMMGQIPELGNILESQNIPEAIQIPEVRAVPLPINNPSEMPGDHIRVVVDGRQVVFSGQYPIVVDNRLMVPARDVFEHMGYDVDWFAATQTVRLCNRVTTVWVVVDSHTMVYARGDNIPYTVETELAPKLVNGRLMLPLRSITEALGPQIHWHTEETLVEITTGR